MASVTAFGKQVNKRLIDLDQSKAWLIDQVQQKTGLYFDYSYMRKILTGKLKAPKIVHAICDILDLAEDQDTTDPAQ